jgi:hypothetical protein
VKSIRTKRARSMYKYKAIVKKKIIVHSSVWYDVDAIVNAEARQKEDVTNPDKEVNIRVGKHVTISVTATDLEEVPLSGYEEEPSH